MRRPNLAAAVADSSAHERMQETHGWVRGVRETQAGVMQHWELAVCWHIGSLAWKWKPRFFTAGQTINDATVEVEARHSNRLAFLT